MELLGIREHSVETINVVCCRENVILLSNSGDEAAGDIGLLLLGLTRAVGHAGRVNVNYRAYAGCYHGIAHTIFSSAERCFLSKEEGGRQRTLFQEDLCRMI